MPPGFTFPEFTWPFGSPNSHGTETAADPSRQRFNDAPSSPAPALSRSRTASSRDNRFSMRPHTEPAPHRPGNREFLPDYSNPRDAVLINIPTGQPSSTMPHSSKPGARKGFMPRNTLGASAGFGGPSRPTSERHGPRHSHHEALPLEASRGENVPLVRRPPEFPDDGIVQRKRQKVSHPRSSPSGSTYVDLTDEIPGPTETSLRRRRSSGPEFFSQFHKSRSNESAHSKQSAVSGAFSMSEFNNVEERMNAKNYASPHLSQNGSSQEQPETTGAVRGLPRRNRGRSTKPIELSDDESQQAQDPSEKISREGFIFNALVNHIGEAVSKPKSIKANLHAQNSQHNAAASTLHNDGYVQGHIGKGSNGHRVTSGSQRKLGGGLNSVAALEVPGTGSSGGGRAMPAKVPDVDYGSEDELAVVRPTALKQRETAIRSLNAETRSHYFAGTLEVEDALPQPRRSPGSEPAPSKADIKLSAFTSSKASKSSQRLPRKQGSKTCHWSLKLFKIPQIPEMSEPDLWLVPEPEKKRYLVHGKDGPILVGKELASIDSSKVNRFIHTTDESTKVQLAGSRSDYEIYKRYVEFTNVEDRDAFVRSLAPTKGSVKSGGEMDKLFAKADETMQRRTASEVVDAGVEVALLESRDNRRCEEAAERRSDKEATDDKERTNTTRPRSGNKLISQLQTEPNRAEPSTRTSRAANSGDKSEVTSSAALMTVRSTRSGNRTERRDKAINYIEDSMSDSEIQWPPIELPPKWKFPLVYPPTGRQRAQVEWEDLFKLEDGEYLNDNIIMFYLTWAAKQVDVRGKLPPNKVYWFNTHFYTTLTKARRGINYEGVQRWTSKFDIFTYDYVVVPINENSHWYLAVICNLPVLVQKVKGGGGEKGLEVLERALPKTGLAALVQDVLSNDAPSESTKDSEDAGDPMEIDRPIRSDEQTEVEQPQGKSDSLEKESEQRLTTPQPMAGGDRHSPIHLDDVQDETKQKPNGQEDVSKSSPGGKRSRKKQPPPLRKFDIDQSVIIILDSLGDMHTKTTRNLKEYLIEEGKTKRGLDLDIKDFKGLTAKEIPLQQNLCDCGVFLGLYFEKFINDPDQFVRKILRREMDAEADWPNMAPPKTRRDIVKLLTGLEKEQAKERNEQKKRKKEEKKKAEETEAKRKSEEQERLEEQQNLEEQKPQPTSPPGLTPHLSRSRKSPEVAIVSPKRTKQRKEHIAAEDLEIRRLTRTTEKPAFQDYDSAMEDDDTQQPILSVEPVHPEAEQEQLADADDEMLYGNAENDIEIPDSQPREEPQYEKDAEQSHNAWFAQLQVEADEGTQAQGNSDDGSLSREQRSEKRSSPQPKKVRALEVIEIDDSQQ